MVKNKHILLKIILFMFFLFIVIYIMSRNGYYKVENYNKMIITKEAMEKFESDVSNGKDVSIDKYITPSKDYTSKVSNIGYKLGEVISNTFTNVSDVIINTMKVLFVNK